LTRQDCLLFLAAADSIPYARRDLRHARRRLRFPRRRIALGFMLPDVDLLCEEPAAARAVARDAAGTGEPWLTRISPQELGSGVDCLYISLGCAIRSELATALGAQCTETGTLCVDGHQRKSVFGLYAAGDVVSDLHQITVATGHATIAAADIHNSLPSNWR
jgi:thioredoxin reductase (NADPH)